jgi:hypothetical protein
MRRQTPSIRHRGTATTFAIALLWGTAAIAQERGPNPDIGVLSHCGGLAKAPAGPNRQRLATLPPEEIRKILLLDTRRLARSGELSDVFACLSSTVAAQIDGLPSR